MAACFLYALEEICPQKLTGAQRVNRCKGFYPLIVKQHFYDAFCLGWWP